MKLLFDQNLSPKLAVRLTDLAPGSDHVSNLGLDSADDADVWNAAIKNHFTIVTKDADYDALSVIRGHPPKVIWLQLGNCTTAVVESTLRRDWPEILAFENDPQAGVLTLQ